MADVQLEHGFIRIANALYEAILLAPFTATQSKIVHALMRLTYGWGQKSVRVSHPDLAERCGFSLVHGRPGGSFRDALRDLLAAGVIQELDAPIGQTPAAYAINKDFEHWGQFSVAASRVEALFGERPPSIDKRPVRSPEKRGPVDSPAARPQAPIRPAGSPTSGPPPGRIIDDKPLSDMALSPPERQERQERHATTTGGFSDEAIREYSIGLTTAANNGIAERWGEATRTRPLRWDLANQQAVEYMHLGIPLEVARKAIVDACRGSKNQTPPRSMNYFDGAITDAFKAIQQREHDAANPIPSRQKGPTQPRVSISRGGDVSVADRNEAERRQKTAYDEDRKAAGMNWGKDPANAAAFHAIVAAANTEFADMIETRFGQMARDKEVISKCADAAGFPGFDEWRRAQEQPLRAKTEVAP